MERPITIVCPNPALDRLTIVGSLVPGRVHRTRDVLTRAGGKGLIVARGIRRLGLPVELHGFVGGAVGAQIRSGCAELGIDDHHIDVDGHTRITSVIIESDSGRSTVVNEPGPRVGPGDLERMLAGLRARVRGGGLVASTGSLPPGAPVGLHARVAAIAAGAGADVLVDADGAPLQAAAAGRLGVLKPNLAEFSKLVGEELSGSDPVRVVVAARRLLATGVAAIIVTLGARGAVHVDAEQAVLATAPVVDVRNATGSGDMFLAGFLAASARGASPAEVLRTAVAAGAANALNLEPDIDAAIVEDLVRQVTIDDLGAARRGGS